MIDRVAKSIIESLDGFDLGNGDAVDAANAAIEALYEPTDKMCEFNFIPPALARAIWRDMIAAVLK